MELSRRIEEALSQAVSGAEAPGCPPRLALAMRHAVFPAGARIRPRLCIAVAAACAADDAAVVDAAAVAIELLHCASLVHDDLPCFDDAATRRGEPTVHRAFGEPLAVLAGDALIVLAFQTLARGAAGAPERLAPLVALVGASVGAPSGIVAGQAWECEPSLDLAAYHRAKTGALFAAATLCGAAAAGTPAEAWRTVGERIGEAYQVADDLRDVVCDPAAIGKPVGRDVALGRPSAARDLGLEGAVLRLKGLVAEAVESIPSCPGAAALRTVIKTTSRLFLPKELERMAA